jgi:hypothetical protein
VNSRRLSIKEDNRANIPIGSGVLIHFQFPNEDLGRIMERPGVARVLAIGVLTIMQGNTQGETKCSDTESLER